MKKSIVAVAIGLICLNVSVRVTAHDEGHGSTLTDAGKQGGIVTSVINKKEIKKGAKATLVYKAELLRSEDGTVRVYLYDKEMNPLSLSSFESTAKAVVEVKKNKKWVMTPFTLKLQEDAFVGTAPKITKKPFNIDVTFKEKGKELLAAFDNLD